MKKMFINTMFVGLSSILLIGCVPKTQTVVRPVVIPTVVTERHHYRTDVVHYNSDVQDVKRAMGGGGSYRGGDVYDVKRSME